MEKTVAELRKSLGLKVEEMAEKLNCSKSHVSDLCNGRRPVTQRIAHRLEALSGRPWHEWMPTPEEEVAADFDEPNSTPEERFV